MGKGTLPLPLRCRTGRRRRRDRDLIGHRRRLNRRLLVRHAPLVGRREWTLGGRAKRRTTQVMATSLRGHVQTRLAAIVARRVNLSRMSWMSLTIGVVTTSCTTTAEAAFDAGEVTKISRMAKRTVFDFFAPCRSRRSGLLPTLHLASCPLLHRRRRRAAAPLGREQRQKVYWPLFSCLMV